MWRSDDEGLLGRLEDEVLLGALWASLTSGHAPPPHPRAAGLVRLIRQLPMGEEAALAALEGDLGALRATLTPRPLRGLRPELLHHLALFHGAVARAHDPDSEVAIERQILALSCWLALGAEGHYLVDLARAVAGGSLPATEVDAAASAAPLRELERIGRIGRDGAPGRTREARLALRLLARIGEAIEGASIEADDPLAERVRLRSARLRDDLLDEAVRAVDVALSDAIARSAPDDDVIQLFADAVALWRWSDEDVAVERFLVQRAMPVGWELYNHKRWPALRRLNAHLGPVVDRLAMRIESDPAQIAYAAPTAQMLVFRAELDYRFESQLASARRAVAICETHRNGRLVYADLLAERALRTLERAPVFARAGARERARRDVIKARQLWSDLPRIEQAMAALAREGVVLDE